MVEKSIKPGYRINGMLTLPSADSDLKQNVIVAGINLIPELGRPLE
jgi:hypothetical protein